MTLPFPELEHIPTDKLGGFYNTTNELGDNLALYRGRAKGQAELILRFFRVTDRAWSPSQIMRCFGDRWPITSVRRAITDMTKAGLLERTDNKVTGPYGRDEYTWRAA